MSQRRIFTAVSWPSRAAVGTNVDTGGMDSGSVQAQRVWLVFDGDLLSVHASSEGATAAREAYIGRVLTEMEPGEPAAKREYLERQVTIVESSLLP